MASNPAYLSNYASMICRRHRLACRLPKSSNTMNSVVSLSMIFIGLIAYLTCLQKIPTSYDGNSLSFLPQILPQVDAFPFNSFISNTRSLDHTTCNIIVPLHVMKSTSVGTDAKNIKDSSGGDGVAETTTNDICNANDNNSVYYTTAILKVAYDGTFFSGWTGGNAGDQANKSKSKSKQQQSNKHSNISTQQSQKRRQSRRSRTLQRKGGGWYDSSNNKVVRTVDHTIRMNLAKIYGNVDPKQIVFEACSRTDAGVHATSLVAQFYCYYDQVPISTSGNSTRYDTSNSSSIPVRPNGPNDATNFVQLPFNSDLSKLVFVLNRMLPPDVRILAASPMPNVESTSSSLTKYSSDVFHPTLYSISKTYVYQFSIGNIQDPLQSRFVWHLDGSSGRAMGMNGKKFDLDLAMQAAKLFACNDARDYAAFGSVMRGNEKNRFRSTICTLWGCDLLQENREQLPSWEKRQGSEGANDGMSEYEKRCGSRLNMAGALIHPLGLDKSPQTFTVAITGDRFMYKMVRNIVGTIVAVACGHNELEDIQQALSTRSWGNGPSGSQRICAPARGLKLVEVKYPDDVHFDWQSG